jgi:hypothetical protein
MTEDHYTEPDREEVARAVLENFGVHLDSHLYTVQTGEIRTQNIAIYADLKQTQNVGVYVAYGLLFPTTCL